MQYLDKEQKSEYLEAKRKWKETFTPEKRVSEKLQHEGNRDVDESFTICKSWSCWVRRRQLLRQSMQKIGREGRVASRLNCRGNREES